ncbi:hypothetical protein HHI36_009707, partial [Cryptolaemus montrouzieri]
MATMVDTTEISAELSRLKKDILVEIIIIKGIPSNITVVDELRMFEEGDVMKNSGDFNDSTDNNLQSVNELNRLKCDLKVLQNEVDCSKKIKTLEKTICDEELIIDLLKSGNSAVSQMNGSNIVGSSTNSGKAQALYRDGLKNTKTDSIAKTNAKTNNKENFKGYEILGICLLIICFWLRFEDGVYEWLDKLNALFFYVGVYVLVLAGFVIIGIAIFGCITAMAENEFFLLL